MKLSDLPTLLSMEQICEGSPDREVSAGYSSDLLSDVMAHAASGAVLVTIQAHRNTVAVASLMGLAGIVICNDRPLPPDMAEAAQTEKIALFRTKLSQFEVSGLLWEALRREGPAPL